METKIELGPFKVKCGDHFMSILPGFGCAWVTCATESRATEYESREAAEKAARRVRLRFFEVVNVGVAA